MHRNRQYRRRVAVPAVQKNHQRGTAAERGYGSRWRTYSSRFLQENPFCIVCGAESKLTDHIIPVTQDDSDFAGADDELFFEPWNHQPLCCLHHRSKTDGHDKRLAGLRESLLRGLDSIEDESDRRNELIRRAMIWPKWYDLETGEMMALRLG